MALSAPSTSLAARPRVRVGGMRGKTEDPGAFRQRMDAQAPTPGTAGGPGAPAAANPLPGRRDNILASRSDGTFEAKRTAYNQQGQATGHSMDEAGNITAPTAAAKPGGSLVPGSSPGSSVWKPNAPAAPPPGTPAVQATLSAPATAPTGQPAAPTAARPPATPRHTTGPANGTGIAAVDAVMPQVSQRPAQRNLYDEEKAKLPPPPPAVQPLDLSTPKANKLAAFNAKHPNVLTGAAGIAQSDATAKKIRQQVAVASAATPLPPSKLGAPAPGSPAGITAANGLPGATPIPSLTNAPTPHDILNRNASPTAFQLRRTAAATATSRAAVRPLSPEETLANQIRSGGSNESRLSNERRAMAAGTPAPINRAMTPSAQAQAATPRPGMARIPTVAAARTGSLAARPPVMVAGMRAKGGPVTGGKPYLVGEEGPEVVVPQKRAANPLEQAALGVIKTGADIVKGSAGLVSMATQKSADDFRSGKTPPSTFIPIGDRYKTDPWYKRIPKQIGDVMTLKHSDPDLQKHLERTQGAWSDAINTAANAEHAAATKATHAIEKNLGTVGAATHFASSLIPGVRALDIPLAIGADKGLKGGIAPTIAMAATRKIPGGELVKNAAQQAIGTIAGARAEGGPVQAQRPYLVGEKGPEIVVPQQDATVIPNHAINPSAMPGMSALPPNPQAVAAMPAVRSGKAFGSNWKASGRPPAMAKNRDWRTAPPPKVGQNLIVAR